MHSREAIERGLATLDFLETQIESAEDRLEAIMEVSVEADLLKTLPSMIAIRSSARDASGLTSITPYWRYRSTAMAVTGRAERSRCDRRVPNRARVRWRPEWRQY